jgi:hypothetical protein
MNTITIQYPGYTIDIADYLTRPFRVLSTILSGVEFDHPVELLSSSVASELINQCNECIIASIGKEFAHEGKIRNALANWSNLTQYERLTIIIEAAAKTAPLEISSVFDAASNSDGD